MPLPIEVPVIWGMPVEGVTINCVEPVTEPEVAVMVVLPPALVVAKPVLEMVATVVADEAHVGLARVWTLLSV